MIKLIATDMDGTLLNAAHEISKENVDAIKFAQTQGITVAIATGRAFYEASTPMAETDLKVPYICLNGAEVRDESFNIMNTSHLNHELVERIKAILDREDVYYQVYTNRGIYTEDPTKDLDIYLDIAKQAGQEADVEKIKQGIQKRIDNGTLKVVNSYEEIEDIPGELIMKVLAFNPDLEKINAIGAELSAIPSLAVSSSSRGNLEITHSDAQKGIALESIANQLNIDLKDVMALGDNLNDVSMLERVGYPVAVENAMPEVKAVAKYVTDTNENSGVGKAIMKLLKEENN
ncbi:Cof-type HAD-IIB family hydrolase [Staphylococcus haemolyticus]|uniref:Cof-type HAD-IIB family hydrolase n=1 Tax=Staphylococcus haemolyticus TaxID=1283 RepID=UPI002885E69C|nr:Cof-type HAD-IIB family hydrolase [Staphylococcus haemolyticus]MDT0724234.1 Cof-type HAD-IIB family hydrolase [Staphylococcus haemolyticus]MDU0423580.1 Cof-type HAD-IIB family hydrolase [Staphylococcus haemolyticus]MDU0440500.1 Cof-type HAD-IIB family hydrolase [Staphylococcus haemolyticus]MDU0442800.1 Cof-type HAD-IIB family hydrolase [Staphylococcus haemolyticus]MDU0445166.1 Cof-type HAD-IIB family hydrolase [Staphylococcus haemolyticus]